MNRLKDFLCAVRGILMIPVWLVWFAVGLGGLMLFMMAMSIGCMHDETEHD
jgi:TctA family transporter